MLVSNLPVPRPSPPAWNRGRIVGQKRALLPRHVWAIRVRLELAGRVVSAVCPPFRRLAAALDHTQLTLRL